MSKKSLNVHVLCIMSKRNAVYRASIDLPSLMYPPFMVRLVVCVQTWIYIDAPLANRNSERFASAAGRFLSLYPSLSMVFLTLFYSIAHLLRNRKCTPSINIKSRTLLYTLNNHTQMVRTISAFICGYST